MNKLLNALGLSPDDRIERLTNERNAALAERDVERERFKKAITDLAAARDEIAGLRGDVAAAEKAADDYRPDALAMRRKRERDRERRKGKDNG